MTWPGGSLRVGRVGRGRLAGLAAVTLLLAACGGSPDEATSSANASAAAATSGASQEPVDLAGTTVRLYTSYSQPEVDALVAAYGVAQPEATVEVFRAPTGQLNARIASEDRAGGVQGDVLLLSDPLSMQQFAAQDMLRRWAPPEASVVPEEAHSDTFWGVTTSDVVVVHRPGEDVEQWSDLTDERFRDAVAVPDPSFAGSAFGALGFFAAADGYGLDFYRDLRANGAVQVQAPGDVITGVAEGRFAAGMTLDFLARAAIAKGSPLEISAPDPGAVRLYAPVAVFEASAQPAVAEAFAGFLLTKPAQEALAALDRTPIRDDVPATSPAVTEVEPDWEQIFAQQAELQADYRAIFGG